MKNHEDIISTLLAKIAELEVKAGRGLGRGRYARDLRRNSTDTEKHLWYYLRANRLGHKFKRQVPIEGFIVDFVCFQKRLIIELDGGQHVIKQEQDNQRSVILESRGFTIYRSCFSKYS